MVRQTMMNKRVRNKQDLYDAINEARKAQGIFWRKLSAMAGIGMNTACKWKAGMGMRLDTVLMLLEKLGLEMVIREKNDG